jgi:hypothetical protein
MTGAVGVSVDGAEVGLGGADVSVGGGDVLVAGATVLVTGWGAGGLAVGTAVVTHAMSASSTNNARSR